MHARPRDDLAGGIDHDQIHGVARGAGPHHLSCQSIEFRERLDRGCVTADERGLPRLVRPPRLDDPETIAR